MPYHNKDVNKNQLKLAAIARYGISGMRWGEKALKEKIQHNRTLRTNQAAIQAGLDAEVTSTIADAMELEVRGNRRRTKTEKQQHIQALTGVYSRMFNDGVDARLLMELIQSSSMTNTQNFKPSPSAKGAVALHGDTNRATSSQILSHAAFLRDISRKFEERASKYNDEVEGAYPYFAEDSSVLKSVGEMSDEELIEHFQ
jgi:hypothetical protein